MCEMFECVLLGQNRAENQAGVDSPVPTLPEPGATL